MQKPNTVKILKFHPEKCDGGLRCEKACSQIHFKSDEGGEKSAIKIFKDGKVSVEEAFYYARYVLRTDKNLDDYSKMEPQINDQYPRKGPLGSLRGMILGE